MATQKQMMDRSPTALVVSTSLLRATATFDSLQIPSSEAKYVSFLVLTPKFHKPDRSKNVLL